MDQLPSQFGIPSSNAPQTESLYSEYLISSLLAKKASVEDDSGSDDDSDDSDDSDNSDDSGDELSELPITHSFTLKTSHRTINSMRFTPAGDKLYTSTTDSLLNSYHFQSINAQYNSPSTTEPYETHQIVKLDISTEGSILALSNDPSFKVLAPDMKELQSFKSGDQYIYDAKQTKGHTDIINNGCWIDKTKVITCSNDSTFRIWDSKTGKQTAVAFLKNSKGKKVRVTNVLSTQDTIIAVDDTNRITTWNPENFNRPISSLELEAEVTSIVMNDRDSNLILVRTRANDLKLYDLRNFKSPMIQRLKFPTELQNSDVVFKGKYVLAGDTYADPKNQGKLHIMDMSDLMDITTLSFGSSVTNLDWCEKTNQIAVGQSDGSLKVLFNPDLSKNGILTTISNKLKKRHFDEKEDLITVSARQIGYNMEELAQLNRSKKKTKVEDDEPKQKFIWGTTDSSKVEDVERDWKIQERRC